MSQKQLHPSDSTEQQLAHKEILSLLNKKHQLKLESRKALINDTLFQVDVYSENPSILCAIYSRIGKMKVAQQNKICKAKSKRVISDEMAKDADKYLINVAGRLGSNPFVDPKMYQALLTKGAYHFENGVTRISEWSKKMIEEYGEKVRPVLIDIWNEVKKDATLKQTGIAASLKDIEKTNKLNTAVNIESKTPTPFPYMYCPNCGKELIDERINFCPACGKDLSKFKQQVKSNQHNIPSKNNTPPVKRLQSSLVKEFLKEKSQLIRKSSLNDWLEYIWQHILPVIIIILLLILVMNQCDFTKHNSGRSF